MSLTAPKNLKKGIKSFLIIIITHYLALMTGLYTFQEKIIFRPTSLDMNYKFEFDVPFEELFFKTDEETTINALLFKTEVPKGVILYFHGNAGNLQRWGDIASQLTRYNFDVLVIDYRGYGKSSPTISENGLYLDAVFCYDWLISQNYKNVICYGRSLGGAMASYVATQREVSHLILETPFYSLADVAGKRFPVIPFKKLMKYRFPNNEFAEQISAQVSIIHGSKDRVVPIASALQLKKVYGSQANFVRINNGMHNNLSDFSLYWHSIENILSQ